MRYADLNQLIADHFPELTDAAQQAALGRILEGVSVFIDTYTKRPPGYYLPALLTATVKRVRGESNHFLRLPVHVPGTVSVEGIPTNDYYESESNGWLYKNLPASVYPGGAVNYGEGFGAINVWRSDTTFLVSARWGYETTPGDITEAARQLAARWYEAQKGVLGQVTPAGFVIERDMPPSVKTILDSYIRKPYHL